ncbi:MAG TPA: ATP synthase subunit I [Candidatus Acidoferrum sp.]|nr:ATP synthase subunit I [Candidatus Acidoferrum sp.]
MMTSPATEPAVSLPVGERTVRRIAYLIPTFGLTSAITAVLFQRLDWAEGLIAGSALAWLNFRWLKAGVKAFTSRPAGQADTEKPRGHSATYLIAVFRYFLIGGAVYVIFNFLHVPLVSIALGLCSFVAATIVASVWEILQSVRRGA